MIKEFLILKDSGQLNNEVSDRNEASQFLQYRFIDGLKRIRFPIIYSRNYINHLFKATLSRFQKLLKAFETRFSCVVCDDDPSCDSIGFGEEIKQSLSP